MNQILFIFFLYIVGLFAGLLMRRQVSFAFIYSSAFIIGAVLWVLSAVTMMSFGLGYNLLPVIIVNLILLTLLHIFFSKPENFRFSKFEIISSISFVSIFLGLVVVFSSFRFTNGTNDSIFLIEIGRAMVQSGFSEWNMVSPTSYGVFLPVLLGAGQIMNVEVFSALQPAFAISFTYSFLVLVVESLNSAFESKKEMWLYTSLGCLILLSSYLFFLQTFYIHTNYITAIFSFSLVYSLWKVSRDYKAAWLWIASISILCLSLTRTETTLLALLITGIFIGAEGFPISQSKPILLPAFFITVLWYFRLMIMETPSFIQIANESRQGLIIAANIAFSIFLLVADHTFINKKVRPYIRQIILIGLLGLIILQIVIKPDLMLTSIHNIFTQLFFTGGWGLIWYMVVVSLAISTNLRSYPGDQEILYAVVVSILFVFFMVFFRSRPFHTRWADSGNRMYIQILPNMVFYLLLRFNPSRREKEAIEISNYGTKI
jgi:hypothetical protein